jgi:outer membrane protein assembly factor BamB
LVILIVLTTINANHRPTCWNNFRGNQNLTGKTDVEIPAKPKLLWNFKTGDNIKSSPVVCNGKIVVGSTDGTIYCLDLKGKLLWNSNRKLIEAPA